LVEKKKKITGIDGANECVTGAYKFLMQVACGMAYPVSPSHIA